MDEIIKGSTEQEIIKSINSAKASKLKRGFGVKDGGSIAGSLKITDSIELTEDKEAPKPEVKAEEVVKEATEEKPVQQAITPEMIQAIVSSAISPLQNQLSSLQSEKSQLEASLNEATSKLEATEKKLEETEKTAKTIDDLAKLVGTPVSPKEAPKVEMPNVNLNTKVDSEPKGAAAEFLDVFNSVQTMRNVAGRGGSTGMMYLTQRDHGPMNKWLQGHFREEEAKGRNIRSSSIVKDIESWFKGNGLLSGKMTDATAGPSKGGSMPNLFLDVLSALMRETHNNTNIFYQFATTVYDSTSAPSKNILIPRFNYIADPESISDFLLSDYDTYNALSLVVGSSSDSQALEATTVPVGINQYGLGRGTGIGTRAVYLPEFHEATSLVDLMTAVDSRLMQNYYRFEDLMLRTEFQKATTVYYNNADELTTDPANISTGDSGVMSASFLDAVYSQMFDAKIPAFPDQHYFLAINAKAWKTLKRSLSQDFAPVTIEQKSQVSSILKMATGIEIGRVSGYVGAYNGFHVFVTNSIGSGVVADSVTSHNVTLGGGLGTVVGYDSYAFGVGAVGRGIALPMEVRAQGAPFDLGTAYIWVSREGAGAIDVDASASPSGQQTRVYKLRTLSTAV